MVETSSDLERGLGLYSTVTISMGAMIGSGIFVLPALGFKKAGPAIIGAYLLAGLVVLPAALSKAEMATAMPESGGTHLYIDRAMGPLAGTVAGIGAWFSLVFKSAFALMGLGAYLPFFAPVFTGAVKFVALVLAVLIVVLNIVGTELSGEMQAIIVTGVVVALIAYVVNGGFTLDPSRYQPFATSGSGGVVTAAAFVFVSYAGVTKIASGAEEAADLGRNLPRAILVSRRARPADTDGPAPDSRCRRDHRRQSAVVPAVCSLADRSRRSPERPPPASPQSERRR